jgi:hypothetical protein
MKIAATKIALIGQEGSFWSKFSFDRFNENRVLHLTPFGHTVKRAIALTMSNTMKDTEDK